MERIYRNGCMSPHKKQELVLLDQEYINYYPI